MSIDSDLAAMVTGWGASSIVTGTWSGQALVDEMDVLDQDRGGDPVLVRRTVVRLRKSDHVDSDGVVLRARGDTVQIDGTAYTVTDVRVGGADGAQGGIELDGRELHLVVRKV